MFVTVHIVSEKESEIDTLSDNIMGVDLNSLIILLLLFLCQRLKPREEQK